MNILHEKEMNFKSFEKKIFEYGCEIAANVMKECFQELDKHLMRSRDKTKYRHKGYRKTCIKTLMGEVEYSRAIYEVIDENAERKFVCLLDEYMGFDNIGFVSSNLAEKIADNICECSYAQTAKNISDLTGQSISHQGVWNVVQKLGKKIEEKEDQYIELNKNDSFQGERETKVLFEEADGVFIKLQKRFAEKDRRAEIKLAMFHEGWKQTGKNRYELSEKNIVCGNEPGKEFAKRKEAMISKKYNREEIELRIFNSDGGSWIKSLYKNDDSVEFQLDPFHIRKAIKGCGMGNEFEKNVLSAIKDNEPEKALEYIEMVKNSIDNDKEIEKLGGLYNYLKNNEDGLIPYEKRNIELPKLNQGLVYRGMGNCEHNVYLTVAKRMKHRSAAWSQTGSLNLCKIICLKISHKLSEELDRISKIEMPERLREKTIEVLSAGKVAERVGKGYIGKVCEMPYTKAAVTESRRALVNWLKGTEMNYI